MERKHKVSLTTILVFAILHIIFGILVIIFAHDSFEKSHIYIGSVLIFTSVPSILIYFLGGRYHNKYKMPYNFFALFGIIAGIAFIISETISIGVMCLVWGIYDIIRSAYEIFDAAHELKENKLEIIEIICAVAELAFGIILCIKLEDGIYIHLIVMGLSLILVGIKHFLDFLNDYRFISKENNKEE